jgi:HEAT repeat protein
VELLGSGDLGAQQNAACMLASLASGSIPIKAVIAAQPSVVPTLLRLLGSSHEGVQRKAARALASLA